MINPSGLRERYHEIINSNYRKADRIFFYLLLFQWFFGIAIAVFLSPRAWAGTTSQIHIHVWAAFFLGGLLSLFPVFLIRCYPSLFLTRHIVAISQMMTSGLLIHLSGGRIESHFHVFGSLAFLTFYRDYKVLLTGSVVVVIDHFLRGVLWPESLYGVMNASPWRAAEHTWWVIFEDLFLIISCLQFQKGSIIFSKREVTLSKLNFKLKEKMKESEKVTEALRQSEARAQRLLRSSIIGVFFGDLSGKILECNSAFLKIVGEDERSQSMQNSTFEALTHRDIGQMVMTGTFGPIERKIKSSDGRTIPVIVGGALLETQEDRCICFVLDLTEQKKLEIQFLQSQKAQAIGRLAGGIAHDFNNLLAVVLGNADMLVRMLQPNHPGHELARLIFDTSKSAAGLTKQLLNFSRAQTVNEMAVDVNAILMRMKKMFEHMLGEKIQLKYSLDDKLGLIKADENQIEQLVLNLVINSRDAISDLGRIEVGTSIVDVTSGKLGEDTERKPGRYVLLTIKDNGCGMESETIEHIFEPFFSTKGDHGTGLGLATVFAVLEHHKGIVEVESTPGLGTTFFIYLPRIESHSQQLNRANDDSSVPPLGWETILLVEDKNNVRAVTANMLVQLGYNVIQAEGLAGAVNKMTQVSGEIHLLLTDVIMPDGSGIDLAKQIVGRLPSIRVVFMSGYTDNAKIPESLAGISTKFISKPFSLDELGRLIRLALDG